MRLDVNKTYKLYVRGAFVRSESGRRDPVADHRGNHMANVPRASRKDVRDAVRVAREALPDWKQRTAYNRGQILYRLAETIQSRRDGFVTDEVRARGLSAREARAQLALAVDTVVYLRGLVRQVCRRPGRHQPRGRTVSLLLGARADRRRGRGRAP